MVKRGLMIAGAALQGIGQGVISHAETVRQRALRQMEIDAANAREERRMTFETEQNQLNREHQADQTDRQIGAQQWNTTATIAAQQTRGREDNATREKIAATEAAARSADTAARRGLLIGTRTDEEGNVRGITAEGEVKDLGFKELAKEMTAEQKLAVDTAVKASTEMNEEGKSAVNPAKLAQMLKGSEDPKVRNIGNMIGTGDAEALLADLEAGVAEARDTNAATLEAGEPTPAEMRGLTPVGKDRPQGASSQPMGDEPPENAPPKPPEYPDAVWSKRANAWVVKQQNGKWAVVE